MRVIFIFPNNWHWLSNPQKNPPILPYQTNGRDITQLRAAGAKSTGDVNWLAKLGFGFAPWDFPKYLFTPRHIPSLDPLSPPADGCVRHFVRKKRDNCHRHNCLLGSAIVRDRLYKFTSLILLFSFSFVFLTFLIPLRRRKYTYLQGLLAKYQPWIYLYWVTNPRSFTNSPQPLSNSNKNNGFVVTPSYYSNIAIHLLICLINKRERRELINFHLGTQRQQ